VRETCKKEDIKAFLTLKIKKYYTLWKMADSFVKNMLLFRGKLVTKEPMV